MQEIVILLFVMLVRMHIEWLLSLRLVRNRSKSQTGSMSETEKEREKRANKIEVFWLVFAYLAGGCAEAIVCVCVYEKMKKKIENN